VVGLEERCPMLSELHQKWLISRQINLETATRMGIYSVSRDLGGDLVSDKDGDILAFPFIKDGEIVGHKYRGPNKAFWQEANGRKQFYNLDALSNPDVLDGSVALVIVEGELDALAVASAGYPHVVSVPDGAPPPRDGNGNLIAVPQSTFDIDPDRDTKFSYLKALR
jgi:twinkle protein